MQTNYTFSIKTLNMIKCFVVNIVSEYLHTTNPQSFKVNIEHFCIVLYCIIYCPQCIKIFYIGQWLRKHEFR